MANLQMKNKRASIEVARSSVLRFFACVSGLLYFFLYTIRTITQGLKLRIRRKLELIFLGPSS